MATFLLVHGAFHGGWCWDLLVPKLQSLGHRVEAFDLAQPGDATNSADALLDGWTDVVVARAVAHGEPVILVGHSRGGIVVSATAERIPDHVARSVYCAAMLVDSGETMADTRARLTGTSGPRVQIDPDPDGLHLGADPTSVVELIYHRAEPADREPMIGRLTKEPRAGFLIAPHLSSSRYGRVPRAFIECTDDRVFSVDLQRGMQRSQPCDIVIRLDADHAPYLSAPTALAAALHGIAAMDSGRARLA